MSARITPKWTKTTAEAFGDNENTRNGLKAEELIHAYLKTVYHEVIYHESDRSKQINGIDFEFKKSSWLNYYSADVKGNLKNGFIPVYPDELRRKRNHRMMHVDLVKGLVVEYDRPSMLQYVQQYIPFGLKRDRNGKDYVSLYVGGTELKTNVDHFRVFKLKNFKTPAKNVSKILDKYDIPGL